jgi:hypothetical protein
MKLVFIRLADLLFFGKSLALKLRQIQNLCYIH